jgi:hypothetical protein
VQFKVPQNIDLEDKIVGPLTLIQFVYCLVGGLVCYIIYQLLPTHLGIVLLFDIPIALVALAMAFLKIQDQPLSHFITAGIQYMNRPKTRFWMRLGFIPSPIYQAPIEVKKEASVTPKRKIEKSDLEKLAYSLDTKPMAQHEEQHFGQITQNFEKMLKSASQSGDYNKLINQNGGQGGVVRKQTANR